MGFLGRGEIAALVSENGYKMGYEATRVLVGALAGKPMPGVSVVSPFLITKRNLASPEVRVYTELPQ
jgi:ABC-type sugar transport system substrate-binding protein